MSDDSTSERADLPVDPPVRQRDILNRGPGRPSLEKQRRRLSADGKTNWCMTCETQIPLTVMQCAGCQRERDTLIRSEVVPRADTFDGLAELVDAAARLTEILGESTVEYLRLHTRSTPRFNSKEFFVWKQEHIDWINRLMLQSKQVKILVDEHVAPNVREHS